MQLDTIVYRVRMSGSPRAVEDAHALHVRTFQRCNISRVPMNEHVQAATTEPLFNPLAPEYIRDPYPYYARLRTTDPMHVTPSGRFVGSRHAEASLVLRDKRF